MPYGRKDLKPSEKRVFRFFMKSLLPLWIFFNLACHGSNNEPSSVSIAPLLVDKTEINLGELDWGCEAQGTFSFRNVSSETLQLSLGTPSCGCLSAKLIPHNQLPPGIQGKLVLTLNTEERTAGGLVQGSVILAAKGHDISFRFVVSGFLEGFAGTDPPTDYVVRPRQYSSRAIPPLKFWMSTVRPDTECEVLSVTSHHETMMAQVPPGETPPMTALPILEQVQPVLDRMKIKKNKELNAGAGYITEVEVPVMVSTLNKSTSGIFVIEYRLKGRIRLASVHFLVLVPRAP
jgi:Protein of unknown function (DUF1573)